MSLIKTQEEVEILKEAGRRLAVVVKKLEKAVVPGTTTKELDTLAEKLIRDGGDTPAFLGYKPAGSHSPFPATLCASINDEVVHGIPKERILKEGDIVGLDLGLTHKGLIADMAVTAPVGKISEADRKLINTTPEALRLGIQVVRSGNRMGAIGNVIEEYAKECGYGVVEALGGHGVGHKVHEAPFIPNYGDKESGEELKEGMVLAIEPMINIGTGEVILDKDGYTYKTKDGKKSAHFEHTIAVTKDGPIILTVE